MTRNIERRLLVDLLVSVIPMLIIIFSGLIFAIWMSNELAHKENRTSKVEENVKTNRKSGREEINEILIDTVADWIYSNSYRTDKYMSKWIAGCVVKNARYDVSLTLAIFTRESNFNITAVSKANAYGIAQIHKVHFKELKEKGIIDSPRDLFNPCIATKAFNYIFEEKLQKAKGNTELAILYYLGADKRSKVGKEYLKDVLEYQRKFESKLAKRVFALNRKKEIEDETETMKRIIE
ncbi:MAG: transglycosylase SLT domain-containing protein [Candidatus Aenigmarchaeota archaeon]|nr:transglycosylase SLT domain-containing protein [Candidatus Aenigmarchaeota archaeon]